MKRIVLFIMLLVGLGMQSCHDSLLEEIPSPAAKFVSKYFPEIDVAAYGEVNDGYRVEMRNSATITFNDSYSWISVNGNGGVLPQMLLFDELPSELYQHLEAIEELGNVYAISRDTKSYKVQLLDSELTYEMATGKITRYNS